MNDEEDPVNINNVVDHELEDDIENSKKEKDVIVDDALYIERLVRAYIRNLIESLNSK